MLQTTQDPALAVVTNEAFEAVRMMQLKTPQEQPFAKPFLLWMYSELLEEVFEHLPQEYHKKVDTLLMMNTYVIRADVGVPMTGLEVETLTDVLAEVSHMMSWDA